MKEDTNCQLTYRKTLGVINYTKQRKVKQQRMVFMNQIIKDTVLVIMTC